MFLKNYMNLCKMKMKKKKKKKLDRWGGACRKKNSHSLLFNFEYFNSINCINSKVHLQLYI